MTGDKLPSSSITFHLIAQSLTLPSDPIRYSKYQQYPGLPIVDKHSTSKSPVTGYSPLLCNLKTELSVTEVLLQSKCAQYARATHLLHVHLSNTTIENIRQSAASRPPHRSQKRRISRSQWFLFDFNSRIAWRGAQKLMKIYEIARNVLLVLNFIFP